MKIQPDQIVPVRESGKTQQARSSSASDFGEILAREVGTGQQATSTQGLSSLSALAGLTQAMATQGTQAAQATDPETERQAVMDNVDGILNQWEKYSGELAGSDGAALRQAYGTLETIQNDVQKLKDEHPGLAESSPQLSSLVNELEVMTVTEKIKFNRGDYL